MSNKTVEELNLEKEIIELYTTANRVRTPLLPKKWDNTTITCQAFAEGVQVERERGLRVWKDWCSSLWKDVKGNIRPARPGWVSNVHQGTVQFTEDMSRVSNVTHWLECDIPQPPERPWEDKIRRAAVLSADAYGDSDIFDVETFCDSFLRVTGSTIDRALVHFLLSGRGDIMPNGKGTYKVYIKDRSQSRIAKTKKDLAEAILLGKKGGPTFHFDRAVGSQHFPNTTEWKAWEAEVVEESLSAKEDTKRTDSTEDTPEPQKVRFLEKDTQKDNPIKPVWSNWTPDPAMSKEELIDDLHKFLKGGVSLEKVTEMVESIYVGLKLRDATEKAIAEENVEDPVVTNHGLSFRGKSLWNV